MTAVSAGGGKSPTVHRVCPDFGGFPIDLRAIGWFSTPRSGCGLKSSNCQKVLQNEIVPIEIPGYLSWHVSCLCDRDVLGRETMLNHLSALTLGIAIATLAIGPSFAGTLPIFDAIIRVPEPASITIFGVGLAGAFVARKFFGR